MIIQVLHCPYCQGTDIVRHGATSEGKQRYRCRECRFGRGRTFLLEYTYTGQSPEVVAYLLAADIVSGPLPSRLREVNQPVIITRNRFSRPRPCPLACI
jgi:transposase-like protein